MNSSTLSAHVFSSGRVALNQVNPKPVTDKIAKRIVSAFALGGGHGILQLAAMELDTSLEVTMRYWRALGQVFLAAACSVTIQ